MPPAGRVQFTSITELELLLSSFAVQVGVTCTGIVVVGDGAVVGVEAVPG